MLLRLRELICLSFVLGCLSAVALAQSGQSQPAAKPSPTPTSVKFDPKNLTAEQAAESAIIFYGVPYGRVTLSQIRKTTIERGVSNLVNAAGKTDRVPYIRHIIRGDNLAKEKIRLEQEFPQARYSLVWSEEKIFGVYNDTVFSPREDAARTFEHQIAHSLEALLRYRENESKLALAGREKVMGVDYYVLEVTDKQERKTRFYLSSKSYRVMMLAYEAGGVKYVRRFYDYNYAQGTLVPYRTVLWADEKQIEETEIGTIAFGQKIDEMMFAGAPAQ